MVQRAGVGSDEEGRICDLIQRIFFEGQQFKGCGTVNRRGEDKELECKKSS